MQRCAYCHQIIPVTKEIYFQMDLTFCSDFHRTWFFDGHKRKRPCFYFFN